MLPWEVQEVNYNNSASKNRASSNTSVNNFNGSTIKNNNSEHVDFFSTLNNGGANSTSNKVNDFGFSKNNSFSRPKIDNKPLNLFSDTKSSYVEDIEEFSLWNIKIKLFLINSVHIYNSISILFSFCYFLYKLKRAYLMFALDLFLDSLSSD